MGAQQAGSGGISRLWGQISGTALLLRGAGTLAAGDTRAGDTSADQDGQAGVAFGEKLVGPNLPGASEAARISRGLTGCESRRCRYGFSGGACGPRDFSAPSMSACFSAAVSLAAGCMGR